MRADTVVAAMDCLGLEPPRNLRPSFRGWIEGQCPFATWRHSGGLSNGRGFAIKCEDGEAALYACRGCGAKGVLQNLPRDLLRFDHPPHTEAALFELHLKFQALVDLPRPYRDEVEAPRRALDPAVYAGIYPLASAVQAPADYLAARGVSRATADLLGLLYDPAQRRVLWQVFDRDGGLHGFTGRRIYETDDRRDPKVRNYLGLEKARDIIGIEMWDPSLPVLLEEGLVGFARLFEIGAYAHCNIGCVMGAHLSDDQIALLVAFDRPVHLALDLDAAGRAGIFGTGRTRGAAERLGSLAHVPAWPDGKDDIDVLELSDIPAFLSSKPWIVEKILQRNA